MSDENKEKYQFGDNKLIQYLTLWTNIIRIVWLIVRRITNLMWELKVKRYDLEQNFGETFLKWFDRFSEASHQQYIDKNYS